MLNRSKRGPERRISVSEAPKKVLRFQRDPFFGHYGIEIVVRYVTRASDRFEMRNRLYQRVIVLLHKSTASRPDSSRSELDQPQTPIST